MTNDKIAKGVGILFKYVKPTGYDFHAEHDILYFGHESLPLSDDDKASLIELGWFIDEESWSCFT